MKKILIYCFAFGLCLLLPTQALSIVVKPQVSAGSFHTVGLKSDGTVVAVGANYRGELNVSSWTDIIQVAAGDLYTLGLKSDGTVLAVGFNDEGQLNVKGWTDIVQVSASPGYHTIGLKSDGTAVAVGLNNWGQNNVSAWTDIVQVATGAVYTVGLKSDGTVVAVGRNDYGQLNVGAWTDIVQVAADANITVGGNHTVGLKSDGTAVAIGDNFFGQLNVGTWTDIVQVAAGGFHTVGLKSNGTVVAVGANNDGQLEVSNWTSIVQVAAGFDFTVGLKSDGTLVAVGRNDYSQCNVSDWKLLVNLLDTDAADCTLYGAFQVVSDPTAIGGSFVHAPNGIGTRDLPDEAHKMVCPFSVATSGRYRINGVVRAPSPAYANNSFFVKVDGAPSTGYLWDIPESTTWVADSVSERYGANPVGVMLTAGVHTVTIYLREDGAQLAEIRLEPTGIMPDEVASEAEDCELYGAFQIVRDPTASGGKFVHVPNGVGIRDMPDEAQKMLCRLSIASGGTYQIKGVVGAPSPAYANNSFFVKVDGAPSAGYLWDTPESIRWTTDAVSERYEADPVEVSLAAGVHAVTIYLREDGAQLDKIKLEPVGAPPNNLSKEAEACDLYGNFEIVTDLAASGGSFVSVRDYGGVWGSPNEAHKVVCQFSVAGSGAYRIKGIVRAPAPAYGNNSFYVKLDGVPTAGYLWDTPESTRWTADTVSDRNGPDPIEVSLAAGVHNIIIYLREDGTQIDRIELEPVD